MRSNTVIPMIIFSAGAIICASAGWLTKTHVNITGYCDIGVIAFGLLTMFCLGALHRDLNPLDPPTEEVTSNEENREVQN